MLGFKTERIAHSAIVEKPAPPPVDLDAFVSQSINMMSKQQLKEFEKKAEGIMKDAEARANAADADRGSYE